MDSAKVPERVKRLVHFGSRSLGRATASARLLPSFLLCGGQRCGTTSLYRALAAHPAILKAVLHKGVHYFDTSYHQGMSWYRGHFPLRMNARRLSGRIGVPVQTFESSPYYMYHPHAAERIRRDLPDVKLVVLLRDPVERAHSQHAHELARGFEHIEEFTEALDLEPVRLSGEAERLRTDPTYYSFSHQHHGYLARGQYTDYLEPLANLFGRDRIHVLDSHDFFTNPGPVYDELLHFLGLPWLGNPPFEQHNARPRSTMDPAVRTALERYFEPYDRRLVDWLGWVPSWRR
ncbi:sulfotransferase domain-containing protein [Longispora albida]|uniref:sulfotransferase domain-containing protein n=1 Tax=Longispora albida TaxID=203523 RepID=UPI0003706B07|nr:sulfotransferase domain-containing protein [Longispora albida]